MLEAVRDFFEDFFALHRTRKVGFIIGMITGAAILIFGFFNTMFMVFCGVIGLFVGSRFDSKDDLIEKLLMKLDEVLPEKIQRW